MNSSVMFQRIVFVVYAAIFVTMFVIMDADASRGDSDTFWHIEVGQEMIKQGKVIDTAIHTFAGENLHYVPHEAGFQWIVGGLYSLWEWKGVHLLTLMSVFILTWGMYRLMEVSRKEMDLPHMHPFLAYIALPLLMCLIYFTYFTIRPQMISAGLIVWFAVWLRRYSMRPSITTAWILGVLSLILANVHTGVWPVIFVLFIMNIIERVWEKKVNGTDWIAFIFVIVGGLANFGGFKSLTYFLTLDDSPLTKMISEWKPVSFSNNYLAFIIVIVFALSAMFSLKKRPFRLMLFIGMMYLGLSNYKQFLFLMLFLPYYIAVIVDRSRWLKMMQSLEPYTRLKYVLPLLAAGLLINFSTDMFTDYKQPVHQYPVEEMNYILQTNHSANRPKVLSTYNSSGYVMFRGGDVLADGRFDPFIMDATKGVHQWTAFERSDNGFKSRYLLDVIRADRPDFLILPSDSKEAITTLKAVERNEVKQQLHEPDFTGSFGEVWDLRRLNR